MALLATHLWTEAREPLARLGTFVATTKGKWFCLSAVPSGNCFLQTLGAACEKISSQKAGPLTDLLKQLPGFDFWWRAGRAKSGSKSSRAMFRSLPAIEDGGGHASGRPKLEFEYKGDLITDPSELLKLGTNLEKAGKWDVHLFRRSVPPLSPILKRYLSWVHRQSAFLDLTDFGAEASQGSPGKTPVAKVFIDPETDQSEPIKWSDDGEVSTPMEFRRLSALEAIRDNPRLALLGLPGGGKSTVLRYLSFHRAATAVAPGTPALPDLPNWPEVEGRVPLTVVLRRFAADHAAKTPTTGTSRHVWQHLVKNWEIELHDWEAADREDLRKAMLKALKEGQVIVFFDGLDEAPEDSQREFVISAVKAFAEEYSDSRFVLTCRTYSYLSQNWSIPGFPAVQLQELDDPRIQEFIRRWFDPETSPVPEERRRLITLRDRLFPAIQDRGLRALAGNPMQLTNMALLHACEELPDSRAKLYERLVWLLLFKWDENRYRKDDLVPPLRAQLRSASCRDGDFIHGLAKLAFEIHQPHRNPRSEGVADLPESELRAALESIHPAEGNDKATLNAKAVWAREIAASFRARGALLQEEVRGVFRFPHRSYQEYLAGRHLTNAQYFPDFAQAALELLEQGEYWRETLRWSAAVQTFTNNNQTGALSLVTALLAAGAEAPANPVGSRKSLLAAEMLLEQGRASAGKHALGKPSLGEATTQLVAFLGAEHLRPFERAHAGRLLGQLGDPRRGVVPTSLDDLREMEFCFVPAGPFHYGSDPGASLNTSLNQWDYWIARFPVTVAQFELFVTDGGYENPAWWTQAKKEGRWKKGQLKTYSWRHRIDAWVERAEPQHFPFNVPSHPRVDINWYEAMAFAAWMSHQFNSQLPPGWRIRLPTEHEWEKAARGPASLFQNSGQPIRRTVNQGLVAQGHLSGNWIDNPSPRREFPWEGAWNPDWANWGGSKVGGPSCVGCFPLGASPVGAEELVGNVWEWTNTGNGVLRGGSWLNDHPDYLRAANRYHGAPDSRSDCYGFRVVCVGELV